MAYDRDDGINGELTFALKSSSPGLFQICPKTGTVYSTRPLVDPEQEYGLLIKATDKVVFWPCQWNLIKTFQTEANTALITKMALKIFLIIFGRSY